MVTGSRAAVRMVEVAAAAGVSRSTVSNVMRGHDFVSEDIRSRVLQTAERLGYVYDRGAASLRLRSSQLVGLLVPDLANPFVAQAIHGAMAVLDGHGFLVATMESGEDPEQQARAIRSLVEHRADGVLVLPALGTAPDRLAQQVRAVPSVVLNRDIGVAGVAYVGPDEPAVARTGLQHLVDDHGCADVAYFGGPRGARPRAQRVRAFRDAARSRGVAVSRAWSVPCDAAPAVASRLATRLLATDEPPAGIQCHSDTVSFGLLRALRQAGVDAERCRVVGCDDLPESSLWNPSVTSIDVDARAVGRSAARSLLAQLGDRAEDPASVPPPVLVRRESCGCRPDDA